MAVRRPLVNVSGAVQELPTADTLPDITMVKTVKTADQAMTLTAATNVTSMSVALEASHRYHISCVIAVGAVTGTSPTISFGFSGPTTPTHVMLKREQMTTTTGQVMGVIVTFTGFGLSAQVANTMHRIEGTISVGATAGTLQLTAACGGTSPNITIQQGSLIEARRLT